eukprot:331265_1
MSALQHRINKHQPILKNYTNQFENTVEPLLQFALILCQNKNHNAAEQILSHVIESKLCNEYKKISSIWILRSEIAEELGQLQKAVKLFEEAASNKAQPFQDIMSAFRAFQQRHSKTQNKIRNVNTAKPTTNPTHKHSKNNNPNQKPKPIKNSNKHLKITITNHLNKNSKPTHSSFMPSPMSSLPISPITKKVACTPLTDDFEDFMFKSEKRSKQRQKKFEFRSRQSKKQIAISMSPTPGFTNNNYNNRHALSPIMDVSENDMSLSTSFIGPPITPNPNININHNNKSTDNSYMNISGLSDISYIANNTTNNNNNDLLMLSPDNNKNHPELPVNAYKTPVTSLTTKPIRFSPPISALQAKPAKRHKPDSYNKENVVMSQITNRLYSIDIDENDKPLTLENLFKTQENEQENCKGGSLVRMEVIPLSPSKSKKYGSNKILSPVRRSKRIQDKSGMNNKQNYKKLLQQSNYHYAPNPMLNTNKK